ncbi:MAG: hypothetical protein AB7G11_13290 [Phycisphaerales bacterium]
MTTRLRQAAPILVMSLAGAAAGQQAEPKMPAGDVAPPPEAGGTPDGTNRSVVSDWTVEINPRLWWVSPSGDIRFPGGSSKVDVEELNLDTPEFTPAGSIAINAGDFRFQFLGASYSRDAEFFVAAPLAVGSISLLPSAESSASIDFGIYDVSIAYRVLQRDFKTHSGPSQENADFVLDLYALGGARLYDLNIDVSQTGTGSASVDEFFIEPIIGVRSELAIIRDFTVNLQLDGGGFGDSDRSSFSFNISVDFQWRPVPWFAAQIGWRQVVYSFADGQDLSKFEYEGGMAGLFAGVVFRF